MSTIDPRLKFLQSQAKKDLPDLESTARFALESASSRSPQVKVLVQFEGPLEPLVDAGFKPRTVAGGIASGVASLAKVDDIAKLDGVVKIESSRPMTRELDLSVPEIGADLVHTGPPGYRGSGVIVGVIDSGIDITHDSFRRTDGSSRILAIWDQGLAPQSGESAPAGFSYGVEYTKTEIDAALAAADPSSVVRHTDRDPGTGHGTHVSGIAAGDGSVASASDPAFTFVGVAPEADIIVVANAVTTPALGDSANTLDAVSYLFQKAAALAKPVVINLSQGDNLGPHDGTSLLERGIDNLLGGPGKSMVKSAGNAADDGIHARGTVGIGATERVAMRIPTGDTSPDTVDIWYDGSDRIEMSLTTPGGDTEGPVAPGSTTTLTFPNGNRAFVDSALNDPNNHDNRIYIQLERGTAGAIEPGTWQLALGGVTITAGGGFDAWIERGGVIPRFLPPHIDPDRTISVPGTSQEIIAVGSYITRGAGVGGISTFSSRGPTRDGRAKPELSAPGQWITSARADGISNGSGPYHTIAGTSMSAPTVAGVVALMFQKNDSLTQAQIRQCLMDTARGDAFTGAVPNAIWGAGKVSAQAAVDCVVLPLPPGTPNKFLDDPRTANKFADDPRTVNKFADDPHTITKFLDDPRTANKVADDPRTINKFLDDPRTINKFLDDPRTINKFADDPGTPNKLVDDPRTANKFADDPGTPNKLIDDPVTLKMADDPGTPNKLIDDPVTLKMADDPGTPPQLDSGGPGKPPALDPGGPGKSPAGDPGGPGIPGGAGPREGAPFVLATPHHSRAWIGSYPEYYRQQVEQLETALAQLEQQLQQFLDAQAQGGLDAAGEAQLQALDAEYRRLFADYAELTGGQGQA